MWHKCCSICSICHLNNVRFCTRHVTNKVTFVYSSTVNKSVTICHDYNNICYANICRHTAKKPVTTMLTYPWKCTVLHCNHLGNTWKPLVLMTCHFDYCPSASEGDNQSARSSAPVVSRCFPGGYNVKLYISRGRLAWWLLAFLCCGICYDYNNSPTPPPNWCI